MVDMTRGGELQHLVRYALPILLANWLQLAYNAVDSIIAGRFIGAEALASEGIAAPVMNLVILFINGLSIGAGVLMSEAYGRGDYSGLRNINSTLLVSGLISSFLLSFLAFILSPCILLSLHCPGKIHSITLTYLRIIFLGTPFTFLYNALASALKSVGDSKTPLKFLFFSSVLNAVLDIILLGIFRFGIACSALTTVVAQAFSAFLALAYIMRKEPVLAPRREDAAVRKDILCSILAYASPTALQQAIQPVGKVLIQSCVNALGVETIAAFNAVSRIDDFACIPEQGIAASIATFTSQNRGAEKNERILSGFWKGILLELFYALFICSFTFLLCTPVLSLFVSPGDGEAVIECGAEYLSYMAFFYFLPSLTNGFQGFYRGMGKMKTTVLGTFIQTSIRTISTYILAFQIGIKGIAFSCALGWSMMLLFEVPYFFSVAKRMKRNAKI